MSYIPASALQYVDHCATKPGVGFMSQARPPQTRGCQPGFVPPMCDSARLVVGVKVAALGTVDEVIFGPYQPLQLLAIVDAGSGADVSIAGVNVNGETLLSKVRDTSPAGTQARVVAGLGLLSDWTDEKVRSGTSLMVQTPVIDQSNPVTIQVDGTAAAVVRFYVYLGNPANDGRGTVVGNMQKSGGVNYYG